MNELLTKISSYNIFNNLFPGAVFVVLMQRLGSLTLPKLDLVTLLLIYYFVGLTISRIGSLVLEPLLRLSRIVRYSAYSDYIAACAKDPKIEAFLEVGNTYRTLATAFLLALVIRSMGPRLRVEGANQEYLLLGLAFILFLLSFRKQSGFITKRVTDQTRVPQ